MPTLNDESIKNDEPPCIEITGINKYANIIVGNIQPPEFIVSTDNIQMIC